MLLSIWSSTLLFYRILEVYVVIKRNLDLFNWFGSKSTTIASSNSRRHQTYCFPGLRYCDRRSGRYPFNATSFHLNRNICLIVLNLPVCRNNFRPLPDFSLLQLHRHFPEALSAFSLSYTYKVPIITFSIIFWFVQNEARFYQCCQDLINQQHLRWARLTQIRALRMLRWDPQLIGWSQSQHCLKINSLRVEQASYSWFWFVCGSSI